MTADHVTLLQPQTGPRNRTVTNVTLTFDGGSPVTVPLGAASVAGPGQVVSFPKRSFRTLTVTINATSAGVQKDYRSQSAVGFAEIAIPGVAPATEALRLPTDLLAAAGTSSLHHQLDIIMNRIRTQVTPPRSDPEASMVRQVHAAHGPDLLDRGDGPDLHARPRSGRSTGSSGGPGTAR